MNREIEDLYREIVEWKNKAHEAFSHIRELKQEIETLKSKLNNNDRSIL